MRIPFMGPRGFEKVLADTAKLPTTERSHAYLEAASSRLRAAASEVEDAIHRGYAKNETKAGFTRAVRSTGEAARLLRTMSGDAGLPAQSRHDALQAVFEIEQPDRRALTTRLANFQAKDTFAFDLRQAFPALHRDLTHVTKQVELAASAADPAHAADEALLAELAEAAARDVAVRAELVRKLEAMGIHSLT